MSKPSRKAQQTKNATRAKQPKDQGPAKWRMVTLGVFMTALAGVLIWHIAHLQVVPGTEKGFSFLQKQGQARTIRKEKISAYRGIITDRNGEILAVSTPVISLFANPQRLDMTRLPQLAAALKMPEKKLGAKISQYADKQFVYLKRRMPPHEADGVLKLKIQGVEGKEEYKRYYPAGEVAAHIVGFTDVDDRGREGVELALEDWLSGAEGERHLIKNLKGNVVRDLGVKRAASSGNDVQLSIDLRLQYLAYRELKAAVLEQGARSGSVVMLDVHTGEVLAMANQPSYNPNNRKRVQPSQVRNRAITDVFEPGSTMKPFTILSALETGRYFPATKINTNPGHVRVANKTYVDYKNYGVMDLTTIIKKSSQVGVVKLAMDLDPDAMREVLFRAGLGQSTGVEFPGESIGSLPQRAKWHPTERASLGFGHGLSVTPLQLAQAYTSLASQGVLRHASLLKAGQRREGVQIYEPKLTQQVNKMLKTVTEKGGTATRAQIKAYPSAGKTGTTHKIGSHGYAMDKYVAFFAGFAPAENPRVVTVVVINEPPAEHYFGGEAAAPIFARITEGALRLMNVPPVEGALAGL